MKCLQSKGRNSHIFRFQREYGAILQINTVNLPLRLHHAEANSSLRKRSQNEGRTKVERKMNEELSKKLRPSSYYSTTKLRKNYENCEQKHYYFIHFLVFALSCLKLRRNDIALSQTGVEMALSTPVFTI